MKLKLTSAHWPARAVGLLLLLALAAVSAPAADMKLEALLIWGTNDAKSPDATHKPVDPEIRRKLGDLPLKWAHYFEVKRVQFTVPASGSKKEQLSDKCSIEVKNLDRSKVEVTLIGNGRAEEKRTQAFPKGELLVYGGNAPNATAWLVTLKRIE
jgi:hypothetical protein